MNTTLNKFNQIATLVIIISGVIQNLIFLSLENIFGTLCLLFGWLLLKSKVLTNNNLRNYPVSFIMLLGMSVFYYILPMPLTLLELKPVTFNMRVPILTFTHHFLFALSIVVTHKIYTIISNKRNIFRSLLVNTNFYLEPSNKLIWVTSILGFSGSFINNFILGVSQMESTDDRTFAYYLSTILSGYIWMPLIMIFPHYRNNNYKLTKKNILYITIYSILVAIISIAGGWRTALFGGIFLMGGLFFFSLLLNHFAIKSVLSPKRLIPAIFAIVIIMGPLMDMSVIMTTLRGERSELSAAEFLNRIFETYANKKEIEDAKQSNFITDTSTKFDSFEWNENYINSSALNRLSSLKISDNCMFYANLIGYENKDMQEELLNEIYAITPNILLNFINYDPYLKTLHNKYTIGDYLYSLASNSDKLLGGALISSMPGVGMAIFGYWYLIIIIPLFIIIFTMADSLVYIKNNKIIFSYLFFLFFFQMLNYFNDRHVYINDVKFITRGYPEAVITFLIIMKIFGIILPTKSLKK